MLNDLLQELREGAGIESDDLEESAPLFTQMSAKTVDSWEKQGKSAQDVWKELFANLHFGATFLEQETGDIKELLKVLYGGPYDHPDFGTQKMKQAASLAPAVVKARDGLLDVMIRIRKTMGAKGTLGYKQQMRRSRGR